MALIKRIREQAQKILRRLDHLTEDIVLARIIDGLGLSACID